MKKLLLGTTVVSAAFAAAAPFAIAQSADVDAASPAVVAQAQQQRVPEGPRAQRQHPSKHAFRMPSERVEARLAYAKTALKITDAQEPQWDAFANVLRKHAHDMDQRIQQRRAQWEQTRAQGEAGRGTDARGTHANQRPRVSAIERLEHAQQRMAERSSRLNEVLAAAKPLYAAFSPEQKQIADGMLSRHEHGGQRQHHRGMHRGA